MESKKRFTYLYKIENIYIKEVIKSSTFEVNDNNWEIQIYLYGNNKDNDDYVSVFLNCLNPPSINISYSLYIKDSFDRQRNNIINFEVKDKLFDKKTSSWGYNKFIQREKILNNEQVIIGVDIEINNGIISTKRFGTYFNNDKLSDMKIIVEDRELYVSKIVLSNNSEYFRCMFEIEMTESDCDKNKPLYLKDLKYEYVNSVLNYIYTGNLDITAVEDIDEYIEIYKIADMFKINNLLLKVKNYLVKKIDTKNIYKLMLFSEYNDIDELRNEIISFICKDVKNISKTTSFKDIINSGDIDIYKFTLDMFDKLNLT